MPGAVVVASPPKVTGAGVVLNIGLVCGAASMVVPALGAPDREAPTAISQRWPGSPWGGLGSDTAAAPDWGCTSSVEMLGWTTVVVAAGSAVVSGVPSDPPHADKVIVKARTARWEGMFMVEALPCKCSRTDGTR